MARTIQRVLIQKSGQPGPSRRALLGQERFLGCSGVQGFEDGHGNWRPAVQDGETNGAAGQRAQKVAQPIMERLGQLYLHRAALTQHLAFVRDIKLRRKTLGYNQFSRPSLSLHFDSGSPHPQVIGTTASNITYLHSPVEMPCWQLDDASLSGAERRGCEVTWMCSATCPGMSEPACF